MFVGTWWSLMPPIVAIALALLTKEVYLSLFAGCALGALLAAEFHPWIAFDTLFNTMIDSVDFSILMFMILLGMIVMLMQESGGTRAYGEWASGHLKSKRSALVTTSLLGALIFVDDYFNCLTVGSVMRPVTDKYKVSRAKLAYIIDATAAPVCIIAPISSWAAAVNSYVPAGSSMSGFEMFVKTIPFNLYAILTLYMVFFTSIVGFDFGLMKKHEENAAKGDLFTSGGEEFQNQETKDPTEGGKSWCRVWRIFASTVSLCKGLLPNCSRGTEKARGEKVNAKSRKSYYYGGGIGKSNAPSNADNTETAG